MVRKEKVLDEIEDLFAIRWCSRGIWTFIQCIENKVDRDLPWEIDHAPKTFDERELTGLFKAIATCFVQFMEGIPVTVRVASQLQKEGSQQAPDIAFGNIFEIKVIICDEG